MKHRGEPVDEDYLYELELFRKKRCGNALSEDEMVEISLFQRRRAGEDLPEDDLDELDMLRTRRLGQDCGPEASRTSHLNRDNKTMIRYIEASFSIDR
jgi:hypothetical protein